MAAFFEHQADARRNTRWLIVAMVGAVLATGSGMYGLMLGLQWGLLFVQPAFGYAIEWWYPRLFACCVLTTALIVICASGFRLLSLRGGGARVAEMMGGRLVSGQPRDVLDKRLLNVVEEMSIAAGVPVPQVFSMDIERGINAFAAGFSVDDAAIGVTRGTLEKLTRAELQGVVAHEFSHVLNGDMRLNTRLMGTVFGIVCISQCGRSLMRLASSSSSGSRSKSGAGYIFVFGLGVFLVGLLGEVLGRCIKAAVSRQREFLADASAAQFTRDPVSVAGALKKIGGHGFAANVDAPAAAEASHLFFGDLTHHIFAHSLLATHPPLSERIVRLDPTFRGEFVPTPEGIAEPEESTGLVSRFAVARASAMPAIVDRVGVPDLAALDRSHDRIEALPAVLRASADNPFSACSIVYALWLVDRPQIYRANLNLIGQGAGPELRDEAARQAIHLGALSYDERLSLIELAAPALRQLSATQRLQFARTIESLTRADRRTSIFEQVVSVMLSERLLGESDARNRSRVHHRTLVSVRSELELLLSLLAHAGDVDGEGATRAFRDATSRLSGVRLELLPASERLILGLGPALIELRALTPQLAECVVDACAHCVLSDRRVSVDETALLRAICDALRCPLPLFEGASANG